MSSSDSFWTPSNTEFRLTLDWHTALIVLVMLMAKADTIRDVIAFPKVKDASCLMTQSPSQVSEAQLHELGLDLEPAKEEEEE